MERTRSQVENSENSPEKAYYDTLQSVMTQYHFRARPRTLKTLEEVNFDKAYKFYQERYADANDFCFIFVGNFEYDSIKPLVEKYIGSLPGTNKKETFRDINMNPPKGKLEKTVYAGMDPKATVTMMFTGDIEWNRQNIFDVRAMLDLLDIRLREVIREDSSGTYGIYSYPNIDRYPKPKYNIYVGFGCAPDRVEDLTKGALAVIDEVKTKLEDSSYIEKVAEIHKRELEKNMKENRWWISQLNDVYMYGLEPKSILDMQKMIDNISAEKIRKTAQKYFDMKNFARFILLPEKKN
jgi:zinc protease